MPSMSSSSPSRSPIRGLLYAQSSSQSRSASLRCVDGLLWLSCAGEERCFSFEQLHISARLGNTPRYLYLPDGEVFETHDNAAVDGLSTTRGSNLGARLLHRLESHLGLIMLALVVTVLVSAATLVYGVPWAARGIALALPEAVAVQVGDTTLESLDSSWLEPSELPLARQQALQDYFAPFLQVPNGLPVKVLFRSSSAIGANAMALPNGVVIFTDDLVNLAEHEDELGAILAHELGHIEHRHGLQGMVQSSLVFWALVMMSGDLSSFSDASLVVPALLLGLSYSRDHEREADQYARAWLRVQQKDPRHFARIMARLSADEGDSAAAGQDDALYRGLRNMLSSHPLSGERIEGISNNP